MWNLFRAQFFGEGCVVANKPITRPEFWLVFELQKSWIACSFKLIAHIIQKIPSYIKYHHIMAFEDNFKGRLWNNESTKIPVWTHALWAVHLFAEVYLWELEFALQVARRSTSRAQYLRKPASLSLLPAQLDDVQGWSPDWVKFNTVLNFNSGLMLISMFEDL